MTTHTPLERARAAGYDLGPWVHHDRGDGCGSSTRRWILPNGDVGGIAAFCDVFAWSATWEANEAPHATAVRRIEAAEPAADLPTLRLRAEEWLGVTRSDDDAVRAHMASLINSIRADRDRLAAEVERMRAGCRRIANSTENRMTYSGEEARQIAASVMVGLRSLLTPTPEAPDGQ